jgi:Zn-dependent peptidase ImmA (M78 family)
MSLTARQVLETYWNGTLPVDPIQIASNMGIHVIADPNLAESGAYELVNGVHTIFINPNESPVRCRFTAAHELGHCVLNHGPSKRDPARHFSANHYDLAEVEANKFAAEILMPSEVIDWVFNNGNLNTVSELAQRFHVSEIAMSIRLKTLGYL